MNFMGEKNVNATIYGFMRSHCNLQRALQYTIAKRMQEKNRCKPDYYKQFSPVSAMRSDPQLKVCGSYSYKSKNHIMLSLLSKFHGQIQVVHTYHMSINRYPQLIQPYTAAQLGSLDLMRCEVLSENSKRLWSKNLKHGKPSALKCYNTWSNFKKNGNCTVCQNASNSQRNNTHWEKKPTLVKAHPDVYQDTDTHRD